MLKPMQKLFLQTLMYCLSELRLTDDIIAKLVLSDVVEKRSEHW